MLIHWEELTTTKTTPFRRNPSGGRVFGSHALSFFGCDDKTSSPPHFASAPRIAVRAALQGCATGCHR
jgi:hypothetical protein